MQTTEYLVTAVRGRALQVFETPEAANRFRAARARDRVPTRLFEVTTVRKELP